MLILKVYVNDIQIDTMKIWNTGFFDEKKGGYIYQITEPKDKNHLKIYHKREDGWTVLVEKALRLYNKHEDALACMVKESDEKNHKCQEATVCTCSIVRDEPDESCPVHGAGSFPPRCEICGKFMPYNKRVKELPEGE